jgi:NhaC family Na+:H+ antiporter
MLNTIWLIICAMVFGAALERTGLLQRLVSSVLVFARGTGSLIVTTVLTCIGINIIAADQYISLVLPGRMYKAEFQRRGLAPENLSRTLEDAGTITSPLVPWNTCGAFMAGTLGVPTLAYLPYAFFNLINPLVAILYGLLSIKIRKLSEQELAQLAAKE